MRILFTFVGGSGHYEPLVPIALAASAAGHDVSFWCRPDMVDVPRRDGFATSASGIGPVIPTEISSLVPVDVDREEAVLRDGFAGVIASARASGLIELCTENRPDVIVSDEVDYGVMIGAERLGVPHAKVAVLIAGTFARPELIGSSLDRVRAEFGLDSDPDLRMLSRGLVIAPFPPSFRDPGYPLPSTTWCIRPGVLDTSAEPRLRSSAADRPTIYFTLGTIFNMESGDLFTRVLDGLHQLDINVIATVGRQLDPLLFGEQPPRIRIEAFIPQATVLGNCDAVISHGGSGSVLGALAHGLPSLLLPMGADQPSNARRCRELGVARVLDPVTVTSAEIAGAVTDLLSDPDSRRRAERIRAEMLDLPAAASVVPLLEQLSSV